MGTLVGRDGTRLAYHRTGEGDPLVILPGGPMMASAYFGDLSGLAPVVALDLRGTGDSAIPADPATYRCDRQADDVEALRVHLGLERFDVLGHSAGATLALLYAIRHPDRVRRMVLANPSPRPVGVDVSDADRRELVEQRRAEPWFPAAYAGFERVWTGDATEADWAAITPFTYGRWDADSQAHYAAKDSQQNKEAAYAYYADGAFDPVGVRSAVAGLQNPVLLIAGEYDVGLPPKRAAEYAAVIPGAELVVHHGGGHFPWVDDREWFTATVRSFLP